jgi:hypothetical protein
VVAKEVSIKNWAERVIGNLPLTTFQIKKEKILMGVARPWLLLQRGKPKLRYSNQAGMRLMTGQWEDNRPLSTERMPE